MAPIAIEHPGELNRGGPANPVRNQEGPHLGITRFPGEHEVHGLAGLVSIEARTRVFTAAHFGDQ
jgi:hypothetical protein